MVLFPLATLVCLVSVAFGLSCEEKIAPKVMLAANAAELAYIKEFNFTTVVQTEFNDIVACTNDYQICQFNATTQIKAAIAWTSLMNSRAFDFTQTYFLVSGTGGANPRVAAAGGVAISRFVMQFERGSMFFGSDLPENFTGNYFWAGGQTPSVYPSLVDTELFEFNTDLIDRIFDLSKDLEMTEISDDLIAYREKYEYPAARRSPFIAKCDTVASNAYWHGDVAATNVENYVRLLSNGTANYCNTNQDDTGRAAAMFHAARNGKLDFSRVAFVKAFSNYDRPPPSMTAYQTRMMGDSATDVGLKNSWKVVLTFVDDVLNNWSSMYANGIQATGYVGDICDSMGDQIPIFVPSKCRIYS
ncbi:LANO_0A07470g1_1 [Lachancea nothofagi CBS 11611]|uniref:LANO_0A07470g1_1 n=1 Tax=Lachancea nothofagi CBS 11611 TaxID=1266666 RepID=A0A1G4ISI5_9SACH|nr:LANO_0A07470g1_1 [Lachancea nothofagi CBS 11611]